MKMLNTTFPKSVQANNMANVSVSGKKVVHLVALLFLVNPAFAGEAFERISFSQVSGVGEPQTFACFNGVCDRPLFLTEQDGSQENYAIVPQSRGGSLWIAIVPSRGGKSPELDRGYTSPVVVNIGQDGTGTTTVMIHRAIPKKYAPLNRYIESPVLRELSPAIATFKIVASVIRPE